MKKTEAKPGKPVVMKLREDEQQLVLDWINAQTVHGDSLRYLIQKDIAENGIRNLQLIIPQYRDIDVMRAQLNSEPPIGVRTSQAPLLSSPVKSINVEEIISNGNESSTGVDQEDRGNDTLISAVEQSNHRNIEKPSEIATSNTIGDQNISENTLTPSDRRPAKKVYDADVIKSYQ